jgi:type VI secretion system secreted protein VgrG
MFDFDASVKVIISPEFEGTKFVDDPDDPGGATRYGIIQTRYDEYRDSKKLPRQSVELIALMDEVNAIYLEKFWMPAGCDRIFANNRDCLALVMFNHSVQRGPGNAVTMLQTIFNIAPPTGFFGMKTLSLMNVCHEQSVVFLLLNAMRDHFNDRIKQKPSQRKFLGGWSHRLDALAKLVGSTWRYDILEENLNV